MPWRPASGLSEQAQLETLKLQQDTVRAHERERLILAERLASSGAARNGALAAAINADATSRLLSFASELTATTLELFRLGGTTIDDDAVEWMNQLLEQQVSSLSAALAVSLTELSRKRSGSDGDGWSVMNDALDRARADWKIVIGRTRLAATHRHESSASAAVPAPQRLSDLPRREELEQQLRTQLTQHPLSVIFIDLDGFKRVNDEKGHAEGNRCLEKVADCLLKATAGKGALFRYGGDEFAVILPHFDQHEAAATAERIRRAIVDARPGGALPVSASIGVACSTQPGLGDGAALLEAADQAMYASKKGGKNRVSVWEGVQAATQPASGQS